MEEPKTSIGSYRLEKTVVISAAHYLPEYEGKCATMHGHNWKITVVLDAEVLHNEMVLDFAVIKEVVMRLDHAKVLNDIIEYPTAENIASYIVEALESKLVELKQINVDSITVGVEETPGSIIWRYKFYEM